MPLGAGPSAFFLPSGGEFLVLLVLGVMLFGRRLPEVARAIGRTTGQLRRSYENFKRELNADESFRDIREGVNDIRRVADAPRRIRDPKRLFEQLTDERRSTPVAREEKPADTAASTTPESPERDLSDA